MHYEAFKTPYIFPWIHFYIRFREYAWQAWIFFLPACLFCNVFL